MAGTGDYGRFKQLYSNKTTDVNLLVGDDNTSHNGAVAAKSVNHKVYIQKITYNPTTAAAQSIVFQDSAGTPLKIATVPASQTLPWVADFGPEGVPLTVGKNLDIKPSAAGCVGWIHIEAYERLTGVIATYDRSVSSAGTTQ